MKWSSEDFFNQILWHKVVACINFLYQTETTATEEEIKVRQDGRCCPLDQISKTGEAAGT
jgi:hypothetical protein